MVVRKSDEISSWLRKFSFSMFESKTRRSSFFSSVQKPFKRTSVVYEIVSSIPKYIHEIEDRQSLALVAGSECNSQNYVEKYIQYASAVDSLLLLDKLRQVENETSFRCKNSSSFFFSFSRKFRWWKIRQSSNRFEKRRVFRASSINRIWSVWFSCFLSAKQRRSWLNKLR